MRRTETVERIADPPKEHIAVGASAHSGVAQDTHFVIRPALQGLLKFAFLFGSLFDRQLSPVGVNLQEAETYDLAFGFGFIRHGLVPRMILLKLRCFEITRRIYCPSYQVETQHPRALTRITVTVTLAAWP